MFNRRSWPENASNGAGAADAAADAAAAAAVRDASCIELIRLLQDDDVAGEGVRMKLAEVLTGELMLDTKSSPRPSIDRDAVSPAAAPCLRCEDGFFRPPPQVISGKLFHRTDPLILTEFQS